MWKGWKSICRADSGDNTCSASDGSALPGHPGILLSINLDPDDKYFIFISIQYLRGIKWFEYFYDWLPFYRRIFLENPMRHNVDGPKLGHIPHIMKIGSTSLKFSPQSVNNSRCKIQRLEFSNLWHSQQRGFFLCYGRWRDDSYNIECWPMLWCMVVLPVCAILSWAADISL